MVNYGINTKKAQASTLLFSSIAQRLESESDTKEFSRDDVSLMLREAMSGHCFNVYKERERLIQDLELIDNALKPMQYEVKKAKKVSHVKSVRSGITFFSIILAQFAFSQYGTYVMFSWDIMEPIMACVSLSDAIAGYMFWLWTGKPWDLDSLRTHYYEKALAKNFNKHKINMHEYEMLKESR